MRTGTLGPHVGRHRAQRLQIGQRVDARARQHLLGLGAEIGQGGNGVGGLHGVNVARMQHS